MLHFEMEVAVADLDARTIEGVVVPYNEVGKIAGTAYRFAPGSVRAARARTPLLVDHDRGRPVGVLAGLHDGPDGLVGRFSIDATPDGDTALVQAASGSRGSLSLGAEVVAAAEADDGVVDVSEALLLEASLLALGAFPGATVLRVAAEAEAPEEPDEEEGASENPDQIELDTEPDDGGAAADNPDPMEGSTMTEASAAAPVILATADRPPRDLNAGELVGYMLRAQHGERDAIRYLEAALVETISSDVTGLLPPQYESTVIGKLEVDRPLYGAFRGRPIPSVGLQVVKPKWVTHTAGAEATTVDADATSTKVTLGTQSATVVRWDWAGAFPWVVVQRSDPSVIDEVYADAVQGFYLWVEGKIAGELLAGAPGTATSMGAAIAEFYTATGSTRSPEVIVMAPDVWGRFADAGALNVALLQGGVSAGNLTTSFAGIPAITSGALAAGTTILATRRAIDARVTEPVRLTANAIGALNVELAVVGEGLFDTDYPGELLTFAGIVPTIAQAAGSSRSK